MLDDIGDIAEFYNSNPDLETEPSIIGASRHLLYIGKKQK